MTDLFISDLHLSPQRPDLTRAFCHFLNTKARHAEHLYILGDLVEAWIGDDDPSPLARELVSALATLTANGTGLYFQHGNRDFLIGKRFAKETGAVLLGEYHRIATTNGNLLICHGDTLCTDDHAYQRFRRRIRHPITRWCLRHLPLSKRQQIARDWREKSQLANSNKAANIMDVNPQSVDDIMTSFQVSTLLHGHTHRPATHDVTRGKRVVLGDWDQDAWYATLDDGRLELHKTALSTQTQP